MSDDVALNYVVLTRWRSVAGEHYQMLPVVYGSEESARISIEASDWDGRTLTVHELGPAIKPPDPAEWVLVNEQNIVTTTTLNRQQAEAMLAARSGAHTPLRLARLVVEP